LSDQHVFTRKAVKRFDKKIRPYGHLSLLHQLNERAKLAESNVVAMEPRLPDVAKFFIEFEAMCFGIITRLRHLSRNASPIDLTLGRNAHLRVSFCFFD